MYIYIYRAFKITPNKDCYNVGAVPKVKHSFLACDSLLKLWMTWNLQAEPKKTRTGGYGEEGVANLRNSSRYVLFRFFFFFFFLGGEGGGAAFSRFSRFQSEVFESMSLQRLGWLPGEAENYRLV